MLSQILQFKQTLSESSQFPGNRLVLSTAQIQVMAIALGGQHLFLGLAHHVYHALQALRGLLPRMLHFLPAGDITHLAVEAQRLLAPLIASSTPCRCIILDFIAGASRSEEHTSELQS